MTSHTQRSKWLDFAKGAGICLVVVYHTTEGTLNSFEDKSGNITLLANYFRVWLMPMFFMVSGMLVRRSILHDSHEKLRGKLLDWIYLYLVWSVIIYLTRLMSNSFTNTHMEVNEILHILWDPVPTIWFIYALLLSFAITILLRRQSPALVVSIALLVNILNGAFYGWFDDSIFQRLAWIYLFYAIGFYYAESLKELLLSSGESRLWILIFLMLSPIVAFIKPYLPFFLLPFLSILTVLVFLKFCLSITRLAPSAKFTELMVYIGGISLYIYLTHFPFPAATRMLLLKLGIYSHWLTMCCAVVFAVITGYLASKLAKGTSVEMLFNRKFFAS
ncbi:acyltransferase family protein [Neptunicella sp. SCSIO 80796]|uniref:acyltransferase family protein n=1 Tax=Neptunicella plasticusilytica TaxID=3117012 RepID=UPI003A4DEE36